MNAAELLVHYYFNPPKGFGDPLPPEVSDETQQVIPYAKWIKLKCACCEKFGVSGLWRCEFSNGVWPMLLCAPCAFADAHAKWTGFFSRKIIRIDLMVTITYPSRTA